MLFRSGYNLYLEGPSGVGKTMYTKHYLDKISKKKKTPKMCIRDRLETGVALVAGLNPTSHDTS